MHIHLIVVDRMIQHFQIFGNWSLRVSLLLNYPLCMHLLKCYHIARISVIDNDREINSWNIIQYAMIILKYKNLHQGTERTTQEVRDDHWITQNLTNCEISTKNLIGQEIMSSFLYFIIKLKCVNVYKILCILGNLNPQFATHIHETIPINLFTQRGEL